MRLFAAAGLGALLAVSAWAAGADRAAAEASQSVKDAIEAARQTPLPDWVGIQKAGAVEDYMKANTGDTSAVEALRQDGQGALFGPGRSDADACQTKGDPRCLAVQVVDQASRMPPSLDPDVSGDLIGGRDDVVDSAEDNVDLDGNGGIAGGNCRPQTTPVVKPSETFTCDKRFDAGESTQTTERCFSRFEEILQESSVWACEILRQKTESAVCSVPVVVPQKTTRTVTCFEGKREAAPETCPVRVTVATETRHHALCVRPLYKSVARTCTRKLVVKPVTTCKAASVASETITDYADLTEDALPGADTLEAAYVCEDAERVSVRFSTNTETGAAVSKSVSTSDAVFDIPMEVPGGLVRFAGTRTCGSGTCLADVTMTVFVGAGSSHVYSGSLSMRFAFTPFERISETEHWSESCTEN